ncbi:hypothetical protein SPRG_08022 [Saprolegnia parasitica CBS 223.65]|uniref:Uncharacterized protein n=1 Tax=Saprolegnia parasitica (strain CBS 223.65) TaxID=695850 RepID=A0A067C7Z0_SAPPC|nr:hypothetical protein SPRG_08022 [Saprolegnia parasitica CBS 223.65]KDO26618.1 hypothetical protein SPRG_08022 [Saprolegnia parasitica CBS 223.65]|eukprot:XP_012202759.1 hypothetical protein SPRG_08022 [Saprolegnia parasitica CBS 223.65]
MGGDKLAALLAKAKSLEKQKQPVPQVRRDVNWWVARYGCAVTPAREKDAPAAEAVYHAIVANDVRALRHCLEAHRHLCFVKLFGENKRTALYVASALGKLECVKELLKHGADPRVACDGYLPADVAGAYARDPVATMKIKHLFGAFPRPQVHLVPHPTSKEGRCRVDIHFSEPVWDFAPTDVVVTGCVCVHLTLYTDDFFAVHLQLHGPASVTVPMNAARRKGSGLPNDASITVHLEWHQ